MRIREGSGGMRVRTGGLGDGMLVQYSELGDGVRVINSTYDGTLVEFVDGTGSAQGAVDLILPTGAIGVWYADQYVGTNHAYVPNALSAVTPSRNLYSASRRMFNNAEWWGKSGSTIVDSAATAPDGSPDASTLVGVGNWFLGAINVGTLPAGTYTVAVNAKRNTGTDQVFTFSPDNTATHSSIFTATSVWQRFSYTFTKGASGQIAVILLCSTNGATGANLQICDLELYSGSSDLGPQTYAGHLYLGANAFDTRPTYAAGVLTMGAAGYGLVQFPTSTTYANVTAIAVASKTSAGSGYSGSLSKVQSYSQFTAYMDQANKARFASGTDQGFGEVIGAGLWTFLNNGYFVFTSRFNGTTMDVFLDDIRIVTKTAGGSFSAADFFSGIVNSTTLPSGYKFSSIVLYNRALSDTEVRTAYSVLAARAAVSSITLATPRIYVSEGDSITGGFTYSYPYVLGANASPVIQGANYAVSGSTVTILNARAANTDAVIPTNPGNRKFILSVQLGANDLIATNAAFVTNLATYCDARRAAGWKVIVGTVLPSTNGNINAQRGAVNTTIRTWTTAGSIHADAIMDFASDATMGPDAAASNTTYYADGTHPTAAGQILLEPYLRAALNGL